MRSDCFRPEADIVAGTQLAETSRERPDRFLARHVRKQTFTVARLRQVPIGQAAPHCWTIFDEGCQYTATVLTGFAAATLLVAPASARGGGGGHAGLSGIGSNPSSHFVQGYVTRDGTYVAPHMQTNPNSTTLDNYGTSGNVNPFTGVTGGRAGGSYTGSGNPPNSVPALPHEASPVQPESRFPSSFERGRADREDWERWHAEQIGDAWMGAQYWAAQRSLPHPGRCEGNPDFNRACTEAQRHLAIPDIMRKTDPEYKRGWNSL